MLDRDTITWQEWVDDKSFGESTQSRRKLVLNLWAKANGFESPQGVLDAIKLDQKTPYGTVRLFLDNLRERKLRPTTINFYRSIFPNFFLSVLGESNFSQNVYNRLVTQTKGGVTTSKAVPTLEEFKHLLRIGEPRERALLAFLGTTGLRIGEAVSRKMSEIEDRKDHARIRLQMMATKSKVKRYVFLTPEVWQYIKDYHHARVNSEWIFPGGENGILPEDDRAKLKRGDHHLSEVAAYTKIKKLFEDGELKDTPDEIYSPHSMRTFADSWMRKAGLKEKWVDAIIGHTGKLGANANYLDWVGIEEEWVASCSEKAFLAETIIVVKPDPKTEAQVKELTDQVEKQKNLVQEALGRQELFLKAWTALLEKLPASFREKLPDIPKSLPDKSKEGVATP